MQWSNQGLEYAIYGMCMLGVNYTLIKKKSSWINNLYDKLEKS